MSENKPLMHLATAVWLVDNTALSFPQISKFCQLHELEVQSIADGEDAPYARIKPNSQWSAHHG